MLDKSDILNALSAELDVQGHGLADDGVGDLSRYPIKGTIDLLALAEAVENALRGCEPDDAKAPAELNATNDG